MNSANTANNPQRVRNIGLLMGCFNRDEFYVKPGSHVVGANLLLIWFCNDLALFTKTLKDH